jgi:hypothetical protein
VRKVQVTSRRAAEGVILSVLPNVSEEEEFGHETYAYVDGKVGFQTASIDRAIATGEDDDEARDPRPDITIHMQLLRDEDYRAAVERLFVVDADRSFYEQLLGMEATATQYDTTSFVEISDELMAHIIGRMKAAIGR